MIETAYPVTVNVDRQRVDRCIESLCQNGCAAVRATIVALEAGLDVSQTEGMSVQECKLVLVELKAIMDVYERPCSL